MAIAPKALQISTPFPSSLNPNPSSAARRPPRFTLPPRALDGDDGSSPDDDDDAPQPAAAAADPDFDSRIANFRVRYRSGSGKKAEKRRAKKSGAAAKKKGSVMLPPVPLREPVTVDGLKVEVGFTPYSERLNGRLAGLGLAALVLVELGAGQGLLKYHSPPIIFIQIYAATAVSAMFVKYEKEKISVWPEKSPSSPSSTAIGN